MTLAGPHHSSGQDCWATPPEFFERLARRFDFKLDACAQDWSAKCPEWYSEQDDGLALPWQSWTWCNPPYSKVSDWLQKAHREATLGNSSVILMFARTDTRAFHQWALKASEIVFLKGRLKFIDPSTHKPGLTAPSPSMLVIFEAGKLGQCKFSTMNAREVQDAKEE